ncbi:type 2 lanthipeptide synthetase LanM [Brucella sp. 21LCYQ03]|nr:type 2 lanthipeptide synthetase LanM [Brucella sp. 21LCYQ03]
MDKDIEIFFEQAFSFIYKNILIEEIREIRSYSTNLVSIKVLDDLINLSFIPILTRIWERALILELNQAEKRGLLEGETEEERFEYFSSKFIEKNNLDAFYKKYPGINSRWKRQRGLICSNISRLLKRIEEDICDAILVLNGDDVFVEVQKITPLGDFHRNLQCAYRIDYLTHAGSANSVYYKPRNLQIDDGYSQFITWWNEKSAINHTAPKVINKGDYGWIATITHLECPADKIHEYYRRYGSLIALASVFGTTDLHMENVIAHGEFPVVVDLETLFSITPELKKDNPTYYHLYSSLLLPTHAYEDQVETSPLSASAELKTDLETQVNPQRRSSTLRMEATAFVTGKNETEVRINGQIVDFQEYTNDIINGCVESLELIYNNQEIFRKKVIDIFQNSRIRILFRATVEYMKILYNMGHPVSLHKGTMQRDANVLCDDYYDDSILTSEIAQLLDDDVPYFEIDFRGGRVIGGNGDLLDIAIHHSPLRKFEHQLARNLDDVVKLITDDINHSFCAYKVRLGLNSSREPIAASPKLARSTQSDNVWFNELSDYAMDAIKEKACRHNQIIYWRHINALENKAIRAGINEISLYDGLTGIALAYHITGRRLGRTDFLDLSVQLGEQISRQLTDIPTAALGAYVGTAGTLWGLSEINQDNHVAIMKTLATEIPKIAYALTVTDYQSYFQMDIISGVAGTLMMLIRLHSSLKQYPIADAIQRVAHLAYQILKIRSANLMRENTLIGYAHGTAGVSAALANYMNYFECAEKDTVCLIETNVARETSLRNEMGWPDLDHNNICNTSWCHGTIGFGFSRKFLRPFISELVYEEDIAIVRRRLGERQQSLCLCHGLAADYYLAQKMGWSDQSNIFKELREEIEESGLRMDFGLSNFEMVGAMNGVSGLFIGDHLL